NLSVVYLVREDWSRRLWHRFGELDCGRNWLACINCRSATTPLGIPGNKNAWEPMRPVRRRNCSKTPRLEGLKKLAGVSLLSHSTLTELQSRLAKVQTCFTLVKDNPDLL